MCFMHLKFSHYLSRPVPVTELFGKYPTRPIPKSETPTHRVLGPIKTLICVVYSLFSGFFGMSKLTIVDFLLTYVQDVFSELIVVWI